MQIKELHIKNYKNLDADLTHNSDLIAFIGNNGSGKSNLLEALSHIFRNLYKSSYKVDFDYTLEYATSKNNTVRIEKKGSQKNLFVDGTAMLDISLYLPQKVIAIYSGEEDRLFEDCYGPFYLEFIKNINKAQQQGTDYSNLPKMLFLNKFYWHLSLLSLLVSNSESNKKFIKDVLKIDTVEKIKIDFLKRNYEHYNDNLALQFIRGIDSKSEYKLEEFKKLIEDKGYVTDDLYKYLYLANTPKGSKIIDDIAIKFNKNLTITDLSEGEKKLLLIKAALEFAGQEDSLFILDEPDAHVHLNNKEQIIKSFEPYKSNRQIVITTHSPTITQAIKDENVYMLIAGKIEDKNRQEIIEEITGEFWNKHQQNSFLAAKKPIVLLVEGKHDKEHINLAFYKLKDEYPELSFDIFYMNSACNIPPMMLGLRTSEIEYNKLCIGVFDVDATGNRELSHTECQFPNQQNKKRHELGFYATGYPKHTVHKSEFFTVENFYDTQHLLEAYKDALNSIATHVNGKSIESINEKLKDLTKTNLLAKAKTFTNKEEFKNFRLLFDIIKAMKVHYAANKKQPTVVAAPATTKPTDKPAKEKATKKAAKKVVTVKAKTYTEKEHLENASPEITKLYNEFKAEILKLSNEMKVSPKKIRISFETGEKIVADISILKKSLKLWINLKKGQLKDNKKLARDVSAVGHWGNGDYEIAIEDNKNIEYIMNLIKQSVEFISV
ncbi:AAA family ATPase [Chitinophaga sp. Ak27]|uniref:AAA family ATPase n=1 Tax=Chitinophaga sp. Ak27 TaxID=2726116 RepID=UPI00145CE355|nr:AAA family ATPase [Chitinophaga sp. Ak27]NLU92651.1 AAA family ATPase [Chitinophaga sp. Ak27]